jgi:hypothetical protein
MAGNPGRPTLKNDASRPAPEFVQVNAAYFTTAVLLVCLAAVAAFIHYGHTSALYAGLAYFMLIAVVKLTLDLLPRRPLPLNVADYTWEDKYVPWFIMLLYR